MARIEKKKYSDGTEVLIERVVGEFSEDHNSVRY